MSTSDLIVRHVSKKYRLRDTSADTQASGWQHALKRLRRRSVPFWALRDVSFSVERGEALGIIGHNGAGKSTILKLLSGITAPTAGEIKIRGRLSALIEVGSGFHPELTGRENIYLNGSLLGMGRKEIEAKLENIAEFAGVRQFLDLPVKRYSSGMYVRLGFAIAAHLEPDILLLDEVLAVGDAAFQEKCLRRIGEMQREGATIVLISHDLAAIQRTCNRVLLLRRGEIAMAGDPNEVITAYTSQLDGANLNAVSTPVANDSVEVISLSFWNLERRRTSVAQTGTPLVARVEYSTRVAIHDVVIEVLFFDFERTLVCELSTEISGGPLTIQPGKGVVDFVCPELAMMSGVYTSSVAMKQRGAPEAMTWQHNAATLRVDPGKLVRGNFYLPHHWLKSQAEIPPPVASGAG